MEEQNGCQSSAAPPNEVVDHPADSDSVRQRLMSDPEIHNELKVFLWLARQVPVDRALAPMPYNERKEIL